ncbi:PAS domain-containing sensor histidine kinase [Halomontanus rarus]|uniref:PAS domain-containing sensor histidine kinase n=1 Tax=Halomontanus rarus TaxID=3034020 RepID=UPI003CE4B6EA
MVRDISTRRERERELVKSERRYRALAEHFPNGLVTLFNHDLEYTLAAGQGFEDIPVDPAEAEGRSFRDVWGDATADVLEPVLQAALDSEEQSVELEYAGREWIVYSVPITDEGGDVFAGMTMAQDITERKESQRQLAESEQRYRTLIENFPNGAVGLFDEDLQYTIAGGDMIETIGVEMTDIIGETIWDRYPEAVAAQFEPKFRAALEGETNEFEFDLHDRYWRAYTLPVRDDSGDIFAGMVMVQDITEQKERERYLSDAKAQLEAAAEAGAVGTWEWHIPEDRFVTGSALARKFGVASEAARDGVSLDQIVSAIHEDDRERVRQQIEDAVNSCGEYEAEYRVWDADDELRWVVARGHVECDEQGNAVTFPGAITDITKRKETERKVEESERRYRTLVENFPNGAVGLFDEELRYTAVGGQFLDEANISKGERLGQSIYEVYPDELVTQVEPYFNAALDGETNSFEVEYHDRHLFAHTLPVRNGDNEVFGGMLVIQDVTERREAQQELRESEAKFRMLAENLEEVVWMTTPAAEEFIYINPAFEEVWGLDREELYDKPLSFLETVHADDRKRVREEFSALPEEEFDDEFRIIQPDGEIRWVHARGTRVHDEDGEMVRIVGTGEDITERKERERQLEQSERRYRTLAEHFPNGAVSVYDHNLRFTLAQGSVMGETLPSRDQVEGRTAPEVYPPDIIEDLEPLLRAAVEDGETGSAMFEFGGRHWRVWATPLRDGDRNVFAGLSFAQDVTEQVEREQRLEQVIDKLETSNERLEQFAYAASHDLQEPLRMVSSYLQLIEQRYADSFDKDGTEFLEFAIDGADRMRRMIDGLLKYSRVETRGNSFEPVTLDTILAEVSKDLQVRIEESNTEITTDTLPCVRGDTGQLRQVFQNLLENAIEYSGEESPQIHVSAEQDSDRWVISVHDEGIGIDPDEADRIFEVFQSLHAPGDHLGTGIGLALCERIIERHGGDIWVESEPSEGATFYFTLPTIDNQDM